MIYFFYGFLATLLLVNMLEIKRPSNKTKRPNKSAKTWDVLVDVESNLGDLIPKRIIIRYDGILQTPDEVVEFFIKNKDSYPINTGTGKITLKINRILFNQFMD